MPRGSVYRHEVVNTPLATPGTDVATADHRNALLASARTYATGAAMATTIRTGRQRNSTWQNQLWDMYDQVPEFRAGCSYVGNMMSKAILYVAKDGQQTTDKNALDALASLFGGIEGQEEMLRLLGVHFTVAGEAFVVGSPAKDAEDDWMVAASTEVAGETTAQITVEGVPALPGTLAIRLWKAHPRRSIEADCPARALLPTLSEIVRLNQVIASLADSRLKGNGILFLPSEAEMPAAPITTIDEQSLEESISIQGGDISTGVTKRLIEVAQIAMRNRDSAAASVPLVIAIPGEYLEKVQWIDFWSGFDENAQKLRQEARTAIGVGLDMPPEVITGTADVNHWGAWQIEEAAIKIHTEPLLSVIVTSLTKGYLHPVLRAWGVEDWESYTMEANTAALRLRPNRSKEAFELWDRGALSMKTLLVENGFNPETDSPGEQEQIKWFLSQIARKTSATPDQLASALQELGVNGIPSDTQPGVGALDRPSLEQHPTQDIPDPATSQADDAEAVRASGEVQPFIVDGLLLAAEVHVHRALERAGNRLKNRIGAFSADTPAYQLYLSAPRLDLSECNTLLTDAWGALDVFGYGVDTQKLRNVLHQYTLTLLRMRKPYDRSTLARALVLGMESEMVAA